MKKVLDKLENGYTVVAIMPAGNNGYGVVLGASCKAEGWEQYATWIIDSDDNTFSGDYFRDFVAASTNYARRIERERRAGDVEAKVKELKSNIKRDRVIECEDCGFQMLESKAIRDDERNCYVCADCGQQYK